MMSFFRRRNWLLTYLVAGSLISLWTTLRFLTQRTIFDLVGQQVLAGQWLHGQIGSAGIGVTNYIFKIFGLYMPMTMLPGSPRLKLWLLTCAVNVATLVLLGEAARRLIKEFGITAESALKAGIIWLAAIAGSLFWVQFTNSRNLEVAGSLWLVLLSLRFLRRPSLAAAAWLTGLTAVLLFSDMLQLYMVIAPVVIWALGWAAKRRSGFKSLVGLLGSLGLGLILAKLGLVLAAKLLDLHWLRAGAPLGLTAGALKGSFKALVHLYAGGADAGRLREAFNLLLLLAGLGASAWAAWRGRLPKRLTTLVVIWLLWDIALFMLSGQAAQPATERYLIMTAPALLLLFGCLKRSQLKPFDNQFFWPAVATLIVLVNTVPLAATAIKAWPQRFTTDSHYYSVARYQKNHPNQLVYSGMDTALSLAYLVGGSDKAPLPLVCSGQALKPVDIFYSQKTYHLLQAKPYQQVAVILDGAAISNGSSVCTGQNFGQPTDTGYTDDGSQVLVFNRLDVLAR